MNQTICKKSLSLVQYAFYTKPDFTSLAEDVDRILAEILEQPILGVQGLSRHRQPTSPGFGGPNELTIRLVEMEHAEMVWFQRGDYHCIALLIECRDAQEKWNHWVKDCSNRVRELIKTADGFESVAFVDLTPWPSQPDEVVRDVLSGFVRVSQELTFSDGGKTLLVANAPDRWWIVAASADDVGSKAAAHYLLSLDRGTLPFALLARKELQYETSNIVNELARYRSSISSDASWLDMVRNRIAVLAEQYKEAAVHANLAIELEPQPQDWNEKIDDIISFVKEELAKLKDAVEIIGTGRNEISAILAPLNGISRHNDHVVVLIHGIRDYAKWQDKLRKVIEAYGFQVELTNYQRFDLLRFLIPIGYFKGKAVAQIWHQIQQVYAKHPGKSVSFIAHSFGTYVLTRILRENFNFTAHRIILCGSVVKFDFPFEEFNGRFTHEVLNEIGEKDVWPAIAESVSTCYGAAGSFGFRRPYVRDRWHQNIRHGDFLTEKFCRKYWIPFLAGKKPQCSNSSQTDPVWWVRLLNIIKIKYLIVIMLTYTIANISILSYDNFSRNNGTVRKWVSMAGDAKKNGTIHSSRPIPTDLTQARADFENWWRNSGHAEHGKLDNELAFKALSYNTGLYRMFEKEGTLKPNANYWSEQCIDFFEQLQDKKYVTECLLDRAALFLELSQIQHTDADKFRRVAEDGDQVMARAVDYAGPTQQSEAFRLSSRFYYNLARPRDGVLSSKWDNKYLGLALERANSAYKLDSINIKNITQLSRAVQRFAANPPPQDDSLWNEELRTAQQMILSAYNKHKETLNQPGSYIPPANILAVITMDLSLREWNASLKKVADANRIVKQLKDVAIPALTNAWALVNHTEWAKDYTFDLNYDLGRVYSVITKILDEVGNNSAEGEFAEAIDSMKKAAEHASSDQLRSAVISVDKAPTLAGLRSNRRSQLRAIFTVR